MALNLMWLMTASGTFAPVNFDYTENNSWESVGGGGTKVDYFSFSYKPVRPCCPRYLEKFIE